MKNSDIEALPAIKGNSRRHEVLTILRAAIINGQLRPGDRLVESDISRQMGTSRGPIREALRHLEQEGLVVSYPYRATEVVGISQEEIREVLVPIRLVLEKFAFRHGLPLLDQQDLDELGRIVDAMRVATENADRNQLVETDVRFHELVIAKAGWPHCLQIWRTILPRVRAYFYRDAPRHSSPGGLLEEHAELLEAIKTRDVELVLPVLERHIRHYLMVEGSVDNLERKVSGNDDFIENPAIESVGDTRR